MIAMIMIIKMIMVILILIVKSVFLERLSM